MDHDVRWTFERVTHIARPVTVGGATGERVAQLPVVGRIDTYLDGELAKGTIGGMRPTHAGMVMHENPATSAVRPNCVIEGTRFQLETPDEYLQRYSDGIHHSALREVWNRARRWMREWRVQLVATTHSAECLEAAMAAYADAPDELSIHKLFKNGATGSVEAVTFTGETLEGGRDLSLEIT